MSSRRILRSLTLLLVVASGAAAQSVPLEYDGAIATGLTLRRLGTTARVLHIGAHPDDENTALFAPLALGRGVDAAYLSLTRGEGGQNGIGPELGIGLGVIRSEELLAARRLDGGDQFFARAIDFGYSKTAEETFRHWPKDSLLADVVAVIRRYRPDVVVSVWSGTPADGHGHHHASGIVAREAVLAAGDPSRFPQQLDAGLLPHSPAHYYHSSWFSDDPPDVTLSTGELDPLLGASYHQVAMASRSRHRSQDQGRPLAPGPRSTGFHRVDPATSAPAARTDGFGRSGNRATATGSLFAGVDTLLSQRWARAAAAANGAPPAPARSIEVLREYERLVHQARDDFDPMAPWQLIPTLARAQDRLHAVAAGLDGDGADPALDAAIRHLHFHLVAELRDLRQALLRAANVAVDVVADQAGVVPGQTFRLELSVWNGGPATVRAQAGPLLPAGWRAEPLDGDETLVVEPGRRATVRFAVTAPDDAALTMPYYLDPRAPVPEDLYSWPDDLDLRTVPFAPPPVRGSFLLSLDGVGQPIPLEHDAAWIGLDPREGEYREPVKVVPPTSVAMDPALAVVPLAAPGRALPFAIRLRSQAPDGVAGTLRIRVPADWRAEPASVPVALDGEGAERTVAFEVVPPPGVAAGEYEVAAELVTDAGVRLDLGYDVVDYAHIPPHHLYAPATARVRALDVEVADVRVGYVPGAGDGVPGALDQLGLRWSTLDAAALASGELDRFDVIVTGIRAYEVNDDLVAHNQRLLDWVRRGGTLIVQYNKYPALERDYAPWPVTIARPHGRVTDETAPVRILEPDHPVFTTPNPIGAPDWRGWVQERGLYFWESWDGPLTPLLAMADPGEEPLTGSLLAAPLGEGTYVYAALAFFRQLPEGVPGAYRLFANLLSLGARE
ncbi:MAG: PIG-L family deacetylase [Gemmatimonadota bacterium]